MSKTIITATNPCHLYDLAKALHETGSLECFYSGYPRWRLRAVEGLPVRTHSLRTLVTYSWMRLPLALQPDAARLFRWQDEGFDTVVAKDLRKGDGEWLHAMPGQSRKTFEQGRRLGLRTVLNHASGPVSLQLKILEAEYRKSGLALGRFHAFDEAYFEQERREYALADYHCAASSVVKSQLCETGIPADRILVVPYAADEALFHKGPARKQDCRPYRILFAGQLTLRKGLRYLMESFASVRTELSAELRLFGPMKPDFSAALRDSLKAPGVFWGGAVSQQVLADEMRNADLLVLPSLEEAFGLVVPQALACGLPCVVTDNVGAKDLLEEGRSGSTVPAGNAEALSEAFRWWRTHPEAFRCEPPTWRAAAGKLQAQQEALERGNSVK